MHAQTIQNVDVHLTCLEILVQVARMNFDLIPLPSLKLYHD